MCPEFGQYSIQMFDANPVIIDSLQKFDTYIRVNAIYNYGPSCGGWPSASNATMRYARSTACALAVHLGSACNANKPPLSLCSKSTTDTLEDLGNLLKRFCPTQQVKSVYTSVLPALSTSTRCLVGLGEENSLKCGVAESRLGQFCAENSGASCCTATGPPATNSAPAPTVAASTAVVVTTSTIEAPMVTPPPVQDTPVVEPDSNLVSSEEQKSPSSLITPMNIGIAGGILVLLGLILSVYFINRRKSKSSTFITPMATLDKQSKFQKMSVAFDYQANLVDELTLSKNLTNI